MVSYPKDFTHRVQNAVLILIVMDNGLLHFYKGHGEVYLGS